MNTTGKGDASDSVAAKQLITTGSEVAGGAAAAAAGFVLGGPVGSIGGAALSPLVVRGLRAVAAEVHKRFLSPREEVRIGGAFAIAAAEIRARLEGGAQPRSDGFFEDEIAPGRTTAGEVLEGVLVAAQRTYQEKKLPYLGKLYAGIAFDSQITPRMSYHLLRLAEDLTYTQYVLLAIFLRQAPPHPSPWRLRATMFPTEGQTPALQQLAVEIYDLYQRALIAQRSPQAPQGEALLSPVQIQPPYLALQGIATWLVQTAQLFSIPMTDQTEVGQMLGSRARIQIEE